MRRVLLFCLIIILLLNSCHRSIVRTAKVFGISIHSNDYTVVDYYDRWSPNGDGEFYAVLSLSLKKEDDVNKIKQQMIDKGAQRLPIVERDIVVSKRINKYVTEQCIPGIYILQVDGYDKRDYNLFIFDEANNEIIIHIRVK